MASFTIGTVDGRQITSAVISNSSGGDIALVTGVNYNAGHVLQS